MEGAVGGWFPRPPLLRPAHASVSLGMKRCIPGHPSYMIDTDGQVWSERGRVPLRPSTDGKRYPTVWLDGKNIRVHRLVALTFLPVAGQPTDVRHLNDNRLDNSAANLAWGSRADNMADARRNGRRMGGKRLLTAEQADALRSEWVPHSRTHGVNALARKYGIHERTAWRYIRDEHQD